MESAPRRVVPTKVVTSAANLLPAPTRLAVGWAAVLPRNQDTGRGCGQWTPALVASVELADSLAFGIGPGLAVAAAAGSGVAREGQEAPWMMSSSHRGTAETVLAGLCMGSSVLGALLHHTGNTGSFLALPSAFWGRVASAMDPPEVA